MERSFLNFKANNPEWDCGDGGDQGGAAAEEDAPAVRRRTSRNLAKGLGAYSAAWARP